MITRRTVSGLLLATGLVLSVAAHPARAQTDPLPSWNDTAAKQAIVAFVGNVTKGGAPTFVPADERIAVFDLDGTLITEQPMPAAVYPLAEQLKQAIAADPSVADKPVVAALLRGDAEGVKAAGEEGIADIIAAVATGKTTDEAAAVIRDAMARARNPKFNRPPMELVYQPMRELLRYLEANGFQTWICSGSPVLFTRQFSQAAVGVPPWRVMGTSLETRFAERDGKTTIVYGSAIGHINDKEGKPPTINLAIGLRPILVGGNVRSGGDIAMMRYAKDGTRPSLQLLINHDDAVREFAYAEKDNYSLEAAKTYGFHVVSMKDDWKAVFAPATQ